MEGAICQTQLYFSILNLPDCAEPANLSLYFLHLRGLNPPKPLLADEPHKPTVVIRLLDFRSDADLPVVEIDVLRSQACSINSALFDNIERFEHPRVNFFENRGDSSEYPVTDSLERYIQMIYTGYIGIRALNRYGGKF